MEMCRIYFFDQTDPLVELLRTNQVSLIQLSICRLDIMGFRYFDDTTCKPTAIPHMVRKAYMPYPHDTYHTRYFLSLLRTQPSSPWKITHIDDHQNRLCSVWKDTALI